MKRGFKLAVRAFLLLLLGLVIAYEEVQWRLSALFALIGKLPVFKQVQQAISKLPPYAALALIAAPSIVILPFKLLAFYWLARGYAVLGISTIFAAKVLGTALVAHLFHLMQPQLLSIGWVNWGYTKVMTLRETAYSLWRNLPIVRWWRIRWAKIKQRPPGRFRRVWMALRAKVS